jgi:hypothetical protein
MRRGTGVPLLFCDTTSQIDGSSLGCSLLVMRRQPLAGIPSFPFGLTVAELPWRHESSICLLDLDPLVPLDHAVLADIRA